MQVAHDDAPARRAREATFFRNKADVLMQATLHHCASNTY
jgi:hypothetical protein